MAQRLKHEKISPILAAPIPGARGLRVRSAPKKSSYSIIPSPLLSSTAQRASSSAGESDSLLRSATFTARANSLRPASGILVGEAS